MKAGNYTNTGSAANGWLMCQNRCTTLSVSVDPHEMSWFEAALALAHLNGDLNVEDLLPSSGVALQKGELI